MRHNDNLDWANAGAPISHVLNDAGPHTPEPLSATQHVSAAPFSGKLIDLLLDTSEESTPERRRAIDQSDEPSRTTSDNPIITLPQPAQPPAKPARRPRIPPLLQGLHQPPPLPPTGRLFPPITDGVSGFEQEICDRIQAGNTTHEIRSKKNEDNSFATKLGEPVSPQNTRGRQNGVENDVTVSPTPSTTKDSHKEVSDAKSSAIVTVTQKQPGRKRKKWSDEETRDLLLGVSRFGIGNWKKILHCSEFTFHGRTAVDLKDRFRTCCPGEGMKARQPKRRKGVEGEPVCSPKAKERSVGCADVPDKASPSVENPASKSLLAEGAGDIHRMSYAELAKLGIFTPFAKSTRRPRHVFSKADDENLLRGFEKHGAAWQLIRDDKDLEFETRHPTDLRDRFRIRYPEEYERAGFKLKAKIRSRVRDMNVQEEEQTAHEPPSDPKQPSSEVRETRNIKSDSRALNDNDSQERNVLKTVAARPFAHIPSVTEPIPAFPNFVNEDGSLSPITLNRNILQWADANTASMPSMSTGVYLGNYTARDMPTNTTIPNDGIHINPMATLKLPVLTLSDHTGGTFPSTQHFTTMQAPPIPPSTGPANPPGPTATDSSTLSWSSFPKPQPSSSSSSSHNLLRTPNLPNIVFPHVPAISARTTMHNLPTPADLLSGLDMDAAEGPVPEHAGAFATGSGNEHLSLADMR